MRHVQSESLKAHRAVFQSVSDLPVIGPTPVRLSEAKLKATTMEHIAISPHGAESAPIASASLPSGMLDTLAQQGLRSLLWAPIPTVARALAAFDREQLGVAIEIMIAMLDAGEPDPEAEEIPVEDAMITHADLPPEDDDTDPDLEDGNDLEPDCDAKGDQAWIEWTSMRGSQKGGSNLTMGEEDDEESDSDTGVEDDPLGIDPEEDSGIDDVPHDEDEGLTPDYGIDQTKSLPDAMVITSDREAARPHRDRIRRARCIARYRRWRDWHTKAERREVIDYRLVLSPIAPTRRQLLKRKRGMPRRPRA